MSLLLKKAGLQRDTIYSTCHGYTASVPILLAKITLPQSSFYYTDQIYFGYMEAQKLKIRSLASKYMLSIDDDGLQIL